MFCYTVKIWVCEPKPLKGLIGRKIRAATWTLRPSPASTTATQLLLTCGPISIPHSNQHTDWLLSSLFCCHIENISYLKDKMSPQYDLEKTLKETVVPLAWPSHTHSWYMGTASSSAARQTDFLQKRLTELPAPHHLLRKRTEDFLFLSHRFNGNSTKIFKEIWSFHNSKRPTLEWATGKEKHSGLNQNGSPVSIRESPEQRCSLTYTQWNNSIGLGCWIIMD